MNLIFNLFYLFLAFISLYLVVSDFKTHSLPNLATIAAFPIHLLLLTLVTLTDQSKVHEGALLRAIIGSTISLVIYLALHAISPHGIATGDVKLSATTGLVLGWKSWQWLYLGTLLPFIMAGIVSAYLLITQRAKRGSEIAFAPYMIGAMWIGIVT